MAGGSENTPTVTAPDGTQSPRNDPSPRFSPGRKPAAVRRALLFASIGVPMLLLADPALAQVKPTAPAPTAAPTGGPTWTQLSPQQREALAPLASHWTTIPADRKRKWLEIADKYPQLSPEGKERLHARMAEFIKLTPEQRRTARENFQRAYELPIESRESAVQQYQALPDDKKKELTERSQQRKAAAKTPEQKK